MIDLEARARALNEHSASEAAPVEVVLARARRYRTRRRIAASALVACAAAGGFAVVAWASVGGRGEVRTINSTPSTLPQLSPKKDAELLAVELLGRVVLPGGADLYSGPAPSDLAVPFETPATPNLVDVHRFWIVSEPADRVVSFLRSHTPPKMRGGACCGFESRGDRVVHVVEFFNPPSLPSSEIVSAELQAAVTRRSDTTAWLRVDAQVIWRARRDVSERVPAFDRVVSIAREPGLSSDPSQAARQITLTDPVTVENIQRSFNALAVGVPGTHTCPPSAAYVIRFRRTTTSAPDVVVSLRCGDASVTINGQHAATLDAEPLYDKITTIFRNE